MAEQRKRIVIIGASSVLAEHCARRWAAQGPADLILAGRDAQRCERVAEDIRVRSPESRVQVKSGEFREPAGITALVASCLSEGSPDIVLIAHGNLPRQHEMQEDLAAAREAMDLNGISPVLFAEAFARHMEQNAWGTLALIGSVAGDRGRKSNYVYGAAKGLVNRYAQGLQHRLAGTGVHVVLIKPGPTDTPMTAELKARGASLAPVDEVARVIVDGIDAGRPVVYAPRRWALIMQVIRHLPAFLFNRLDI